MPGLTKQQLLKQGFRLTTKYSPDEEDYYFLRFPVLYYRRTPTLEAEIFMKPHSRKIAWTVYDMRGNVYAGYHNAEYANELAPQIDTAIEQKVHSLGIADWSTQTNGKTKRRRKTQKTTSKAAKSGKPATTDDTATRKPKENGTRRGNKTRV